MRSRSVRLTIGLIALLALVGAAFLLIDSEKQIATARTQMRAFDLHARETRDVIGELRSAQQAYVAAGQGREFWMPKVDSTHETAVAKTAALRTEAGIDAAKVALDRAAEAIAEFNAIDTRVREYLTAGQELMAADVVFTEGAAAVASAARDVDEARVAEQVALDASEAGVRRRQALAAAGAGGVAALVIVLLSATGATRKDPIEAEELVDSSSVRDSRLLGLDAIKTAPAARGESSMLKSAAELCADFGRVRDVRELTALLGRAAAVMEASGLVVWLGDTAGGDLRPVLAHGYPEQALARMPAVPRSANNAAAAAYRSGSLQIVLSKPGRAAGAIVAPLLSPEGCVGALSIEIKGGAETSDAVQALAGIFAAQLAGILPASAVEATPAENRAASG